MEWRRRTGMAMAFAVAAIGVLFAVQTAQPDPILAEVVGPIDTGSDELLGSHLIRWTDADGLHEATVVIPLEYEGEAFVPIAIDLASLEPYVTDGTWPFAAYLIAGVLGGLLGLIVSLSIDGYGYVRGTGQVSETPDLNVAEDRGFYWRT